MKQNQLHILNLAKMNSITCQRFWTKLLLKALSLQNVLNGESIEIQNSNASIGQCCIIFINIKFFQTGPQLGCVKSPSIDVPWSYFIQY